MSKQLKEDDETLLNTQPPRDVIAFNELRSCADLFRLYDEKTLEIQPKFQRDVVWKPADQSKFIDSLVKQLPIPSMCFSLDFKTQKWQVVDGLQRMTSIVSFLHPTKIWRLSKLAEIEPRIAGVTNHQLRDGDEDAQVLYRRVQNLSLPITVIRCDETREDHSEYLFTIFHRLNSGGKRLNNQEIRNCIFSGPYNDHLKNLDANSEWKLIKELIPGKGSRFKSTELILRFFALKEAGTQYRGNMPTFLNNYMRENRNASGVFTAKQEKMFDDTARILIRAAKKSEVKNLSYTLVETAMVGIASNLKRLSTLHDLTLAKQLEKLSNTYAISGAESKTDTTASNKVRDRIAEAMKIFAD